MDANRIKIVKTGIDEYVNIPINMQWDFTGRDEAISEYETSVIEEVIGQGTDFEISRFPQDIFSDFTSAINYEFYFYDYLLPITANTIGNWGISYLNVGFTPQQIYYYAKPFTKSFFKLDLYNSPEDKNQQLYLSIILPVQQGDTQTVILSPQIGPIEIKKPKMILDYIGDKEGFFIYWLRKRDYIDVDKFYMTANFFDGRTGVFRQMTNTKQDLITPNKFTFDNSKYFYYRVDLDYNNKTYKVYSTSTNLRVGDSITPIKFYEYVNP